MPWLAALAAALVVLALIAAGLALAGRDDAASTSTAPTAGATTTAAGTAGTTAAPTTAQATTARPAATTAAPAPAPSPDAWPRHRDADAGYTIAYPPGWQVRRLDATRTDLTDPRTGTYLRVDWTDEPGDPLEAWQRQSRAFGSSREGYEQLRLEETRFQGFPAAIWEYRYRAGGALLHASNVTFVASKERAYALNFQTADSRWEAEQDLRRRLEESFQLTEPSGKEGDRD